MTAPLKVFISYAHADEAHRKTLANHLSALEDEGLITIWHDRKITGCRAWAGAIDDALRSADIVLLISADFFASDYCNDVELTEAIRRHDAAQARVVPVILRSCDWEHSRFARFNALPPDGVPVVEPSTPTNVLWPWPMRWNEDAFNHLIHLQLAWVNGRFETLFIVALSRTRNCARQHQGGLCEFFEEETGIVTTPTGY